MGLLKKKTRRKTARQRLQKLQIGCDFCWEWLPIPDVHREVFSGEGCLGGRCECGAAFVIDETGHEGGLAQLDVLAMLCEGDLDRAMRLDVGREVEIKTRDLGQRERRAGGRSPAQGQLPAKVWFVRFK